MLEIVRPESEAPREPHASRRRQIAMGMTRTGLTIALTAVAAVSACSTDDGSYETAEFRPNVGIVNEREPLVMSGISSSARLGDTVTYQMPVGLMLGSTPIEYVASVGSGRGGEQVEVVPSRIVLDPEGRGVLDVTVTMPRDASSHDGSTFVTVDIGLASSLADESSIDASGRIQIEVVGPEQPLRPAVVDDFMFWGEAQSIDVLANDFAIEGEIDPSSLRVVETFPPVSGPEPFVENGRISIPGASDRSNEGAQIDYEVCSTEQQCSDGTLTLYIEGTF